MLKPGGLLLNFDANYGATNFAETSDLPENHAHNQLGNSLMQECEDIKRQLLSAPTSALPGTWKSLEKQEWSRFPLIWD